MTSLLNDLGWGYAHNQGRVYLEAVFGRRVHTEVLEEIPEEGSEPILEEKAASGEYDMFITASFGYMEPTEAVAKRHPEMYFLHIAGFKKAPNFANAFGRIYQARFLTGLIAGSMNVSEVGYVAAFPIAQVLRGINAFYFGLKETNPNATLRVIWTNSWLDLELERGATLELLDTYNSGLIAQHQNSYAAQEAALQKGRYSIGYNSDMGAVNGASTLTSALWHWGPLYRRFVERILNQTWETESYWGGIADGILDFAEPSSLVPEEAKVYAMKRRQDIIEGKERIFCGDKVKKWNPGADGCLNDSQLLSLPSLADGILDAGTFTIGDDEVTLPTGMIIGISVVNSLCIVLVFVFAVLLVIFRNKRIIRAASPEFNVLILMGGLMLFITVFLLMPSPTDALCNAQIWLGGLGFTLFFGVLLAKVWRTAKIVNYSQRLLFLKFKNYQLLPHITFFLTIELILLILLTSIDAPRREKVWDDDDLDKHEYRYRCKYPTAALIIMLLLVIYKVIFLILASLLSFSTRKFNKVFNESKQIGYAVYDITFAFVVIVPIVIIVDDYNARFLLLSLALIFATLIAMLVLFVPRFYMIATGKGNITTMTTANVSHPSQASS